MSYPLFLVVEIVIGAGTHFSRFSSVFSMYVDEDIEDNWSDEDDGYDDLLLAASRMVEGVTDVVNEVAEGEVDVSSSDELPGLHTPWGSVRNF